VGAGYGGNPHGQPPWGPGDVRAGCTRWQVRSAERRFHYSPATKGQFLGASPIQCSPSVLLDDPTVPQQCQARAKQLRPPSCSVMIPSDTGHQVFLVSQLTSQDFLKDTPICSSVQKHSPPWYTQPYTARRLYAPETRTCGDGTEKEGRDAGKLQAPCMSVNPPLRATPCSAHKPCEACRQRL